MDNALSLLVFPVIVIEFTLQCYTHYNIIVSSNGRLVLAILGYHSCISHHSDGFIAYTNPHITWSHHQPIILY